MAGPVQRRAQARPLRLRARMARDTALAERTRAYIDQHRGASWQRDREIDPAEYAEYWSRPRVSEMALHASFGLFLIGGYLHTADDLEAA